MQGPRLYRFFNYEMPLYLPAPVAGWNPDANPWELPINEAVQLDNFLFRPGKLVNRGPLVVSADLSTWAPLNTAGVAVTNTGYAIGRKSTSGGQVDPWNAPLLQPAATALASGLTTGLWVVGGSPTTFTYANADSIPGPRWINFYGELYGISYDSAGAAVSDAGTNYYMKPLSLCTMTKQPPQGSPTDTGTTYADGGGINLGWFNSGGNWVTTAATNSVTATSQTQFNAYGSSWYQPSGNTWQSNNASGPANTAVLGCNNFGFSIPAGSQILGVQFTINASGAPGGVGGHMPFMELIYNNASLGTNQSSNPAFSGSSWTTLTTGGNGNDWGASLTPAMVNDPSFGAAFYFYGSGPYQYEVETPAGSGNVSMSMTVWYVNPQQTNLLKITGFGFSLPSNAIIQGISVTISREATAYLGASGVVTDTNVQLIKGGVVQSTNRSRGDSWPASWAPNSWGGSTDLWGGTWLYSDINATNFGVAIAATVEGEALVSGTGVQIQVFYTLAGLPTITPLTNAPHGAFDLIGYQSRIWLLGGIDTPGGGTTHDPLALFFSNPIAAGGGSATADWTTTDPVSSITTTNIIHMNGDTSDYGVGLATVRNALVILRRASVYVLKGSTTTNYALYPVSQEVGCIDARSIIETDQGVYFLSNEGLMLTNGVKVMNVSTTITRVLQDAIRAEQRAVLNGKNGYATCARTSQGHLIVSIGIGAAGGSYTPIFTAMYDPDIAKGGAWTRITSQLWISDGTQLNGNNYAGQLFDYRAPKQLIAIGDKYVTTFEDEHLRQTFLDPHAGLYDQMPSGSNPFVAIPMVWSTPVPAITSSLKRVVAIAKRYYLDHSFAATALVPTTGWSVVPIDPFGNTLDTVQNVPITAKTTPTGSQTISSAPTLTGFVSGVSPVTGATILRYNRDWQPEIEDCTFKVSWSDIARTAQTPATVAEIYGLGVEFQRSRDLR